MKDRILAFLLVVSLLHEVKICKACIPGGDDKGIKMCTVDSVTGSLIVLTTFYTAVNTCLCTIEVSSGQFTVINTGQPTSSACGTRIDITNGSISTGFQCNHSQLYNPTGILFKSGEITLHKQSNSTEDDVRYCLMFTGTAITISCYGNDSLPPTTTTTETSGNNAIPPTSTAQQPPSKSLPTSSQTTAKHTTVLTWGTTNPQGDNADMNVAVIVAPTLGIFCITVGVIVVFFLCRRSTSKKQMEEDEGNDGYTSLSNHREGNSNYEALNSIQIPSVSVEKVMYENVAS